MKIAIIVGSIREGRRTDRLAQWVKRAAEKLEGIETEILDLKDYPMPFFNENASPRFNPERKIDPTAQKWLDKLKAADGFVVVAPEYDHSIPGVLKNAIDYIDWQVAKKPMAIVSHGTVGGARAAEHLKGIISEVQAVPLPVNVAFVPRVADSIDEQGNLSAELAAQEHGPNGALKAMLDDLVWYTKALATARTEQQNT